MWCHMLQRRLKHRPHSTRRWPCHPVTPRHQLLQAPPVTTELFLDSGSAPQRPKGTSLFPHLFVTRGDGCKKIELGQATWAKYFGALRRLAAHPTFPLASFPALLQHEEDLANMAITWDWLTCRRWSKRVFQMIADGRLRDGWQDLAAIKDVQRDVCTDAVRALQARPPIYHAPESLHTLSAPSSASSTIAFISN